MIENNFNQFDTRPIYLNHAINQLKDYESAIRPHNLSFYDSLDDYDPDVYFVDAAVINNDCIHYLKENKNVTVVIDVSMIMDKHIFQLDGIVRDLKINCKFFTSNKFNHEDKDLNTKTRIFKLIDCYDEGLDQQHSQQSVASYSFPSYFYTDDMFGKIMEPDETYENLHTMSCVPKANAKIDIYSNISFMCQLIKNYENGIFYFGRYIPQLFFHSVMNNKVTAFKCDDRYLNTINGICKKIFDLQDEESIFKDTYNCEQQKLRQVITEKHNPINRARRLLSQLN